jgi:hypothetical protein
VLETRSPGYLIRVGTGELDLHEFERLLASARDADAKERAARLREALALWRGAPLADFEYESFAQAEAARLAELRQVALEARIEADLELGGGSELVAELQTLVAGRPLQERPRALLMRALYRAGRQTDALDVYREGKRVLDEELGLEPGPELRDLERAILRQDPALAEQYTEEPLRSLVAVPESVAGLDVLLPLVEGLARGPIRRELVLGAIVPAAELSTTTATLDLTRRALANRGTTARVAAFSSSTPADDVVRLAAMQETDLLVLTSHGNPLDGAFASVFEHATSDLAVLVEGGGAVASGAVVVPFGAFEHDWAALELGAWVAVALERPLRLIGALDPDSRRRDASRLLADASLIVQHTTGVVAEPLLGPPGPAGVATLADGAGLLVLGLSDRWRSEGLGKTRSKLLESPVAPTVLVRRGLRPSGIAPDATLTRFTWSIERSRI